MEGSGYYYVKDNLGCHGSLSEWGKIALGVWNPCWPAWRQQKAVFLIRMVSFCPKWGHLLDSMWIMMILEVVYFKSPDRSWLSWFQKVREYVQGKSGLGVIWRYGLLSSDLEGTRMREVLEKVQRRMFKGCHYAVKDWHVLFSPIRMQGVSKPIYFAVLRPDQMLFISPGNMHQEVTLISFFLVVFFFGSRRLGSRKDGGVFL